MSKTDFFDDDLVKHRARADRIKMGPGDDTSAGSGEVPSSSDIPSRPVSELNLTRMARHKDEVNSQVAHAMEELELLRTRQEDLERERQALESLRRKQHEYEAGKRELVSHLNQSLIKLEKEELRADKVREVLSSSREEFTRLLEETATLNEEDWPEENIAQELDKALTRIDQVRMEYNKGLSRIEALGDSAPAAPTAHQPMMFEEGSSTGAALGEQSFGYWLKVGLAVTSPLVVVLALIALLWYLTHIGLV